PLRHRRQRFEAKAPPTKNDLPVGAASAATLGVIENQGLGIAGAAFAATLCLIEDGSSGLKPLLQKMIFL
ncbi:hypothetical protein, partial [Thermoflexus hugenholtzii]